MSGHAHGAVESRHLQLCAQAKVPHEAGGTVTTPQLPRDDMPDAPAVPSGSALTPEALNRLWAGAEAELRRMAHQRLRLERTGHTLGTTGLVNEVYLKLVAQRNVSWSE